MKTNKIIAMIPARIGSTRLKMKNLALINGRPLIGYAINAAKESGVFDQVFINSDHDVFSSIAKEYSVEFYLRPKALGLSQTRSDHVIADFIDKHETMDILVWVNPIAPFLDKNQICNTVKYFLKNQLHSLITAEERNVHCVFDGSPVNYNPTELFSRTQDLKPVHAFSYALMMWNTKIFKAQFNRLGHALFCGKFRTFSLDRLSSIIIKNKSDLILADYIMRNLNKTSSVEYKIMYHPVVESI